MENYGQHYSVMKNEILSYFSLAYEQKQEGMFADLTFGAGGHSFAIVEKFPNGKVVSTDQDPEAIANGRARIEAANYQNKIELIQSNFNDFPEKCKGRKFDGIMLDLGVSSHQFDSEERGFSFRFDAPLDMRMACDNDEFMTAADVLNQFDEEDIANIIFNYGEERYSRRIARAIVEKREETPFATTKQLEDIVFHCYPKKERFSKLHPATRTFQALRIFINKELEVLENTLPKLYEMLEVNGVVAVISFHSLEDRIVKTIFKKLKENNERSVSILTKRPVLPTEEEVQENSRSRSAKLRVLQRIS